MCIIRQLMHKHSIIDCYPMILDDSGKSDAPYRYDSLTPDICDSSVSSSTDGEESSYSCQSFGYSLGDDDDTNSSEEEDHPQREAYSSIPISEKIAQDVLVFKRIAGMMSSKSLFHIVRETIGEFEQDVYHRAPPTHPKKALQNKRAESCTTDYNVASNMRPSTLLHLLSANNQAGPSVAGGDPWKSSCRDQAFSLPGRSNSSNSLRRIPTPPPTQTRKVQFARDESGSGRVRCEVKEVERITDPSLWWQRKDMAAIRNDCTIVTRNHRHLSDYISAIDGLWTTHQKWVSKDRVSRWMQTLSQHEPNRGLENHVATRVHEMYGRHIQAVLDAQDRMFDTKLLGTDAGTNAISQAAMQTSLASKAFAARLGEHDAEAAQYIQNPDSTEYEETEHWVDPSEIDPTDDEALLETIAALSENRDVPPTPPASRVSNESPSLPSAKTSPTPQRRTTVRRPPHRPTTFPLFNYSSMFFLPSFVEKF